MNIHTCLVYSCSMLCFLPLRNIHPLSCFVPVVQPFLPASLSCAMLCLYLRALLAAEYTAGRCVTRLLVCRKAGCMERRFLQLLNANSIKSVPVDKHCFLCRSPYAVNPLHAIKGTGVLLCAIREQLVCIGFPSHSSNKVMLLWTVENYSQFHLIGAPDRDST